MKNTRFHFTIGKTGYRIVMPLIMVLASCGEAPKEPDPLPPILAELKAERAKLGNPVMDPDHLDILRVKAARAGDETERKGVIAQLHDADLWRKERAAAMAKNIGGWDMIRGLAGMLGDTNGWRSAKTVRSPTGEEPQSSIIFVPPSLMAAMMLSQIVEKSPDEVKGKYWKHYTDADVEVWKKWWEQNKAKYEDKGK